MLNILDNFILGFFHWFNAFWFLYLNRHFFIDSRTFTSVIPMEYSSLARSSNVIAGCMFSSLLVFFSLIACSFYLIKSIWIASNWSRNKNYEQFWTPCTSVWMLCFQLCDHHLLLRLKLEVKCAVPHRLKRTVLIMQFNNISKHFALQFTNYKRMQV